MRFGHPCRIEKTLVLSTGFSAGLPSSQCPFTVPHEASMNVQMELAVWIAA